MKNRRREALQGLSDEERGVLFAERRRGCDFQRLLDHTEAHRPGDAPVQATAIASIEFSDGTKDVFRLCEACAADQEDVGPDDSRIKAMTILRRLDEGPGAEAEGGDDA